MTTLFDATLELARFCSDCISGTATGGSTSGIVDSNLTAPADKYVNGTAFITSGSAMSQTAFIESQMEDAVDFRDALTASIQAGNTYTLAMSTFPLYRLQEAVNASISHILVQKQDQTLTVSNTTNIYTLPTGVSDVRRVEVAAQTVAPYYFSPIYSWVECAGTLEVTGGIAIEDYLMPIRLTYAAEHGPVTGAAIIDPVISPDYIKAAGAVYLWRNILQRTHKDNPIAMDMLNEAKAMEAAEKMRTDRLTRFVQPRDVRMQGFDSL